MSDALSFFPAAHPAKPVGLMDLPVQVDVVNVELVAPLPWRGTSVLAQTLLKHLLFMRQQIPM